MSERSSMVSQYFYCDKCRDVFEDAMRSIDLSQGGRMWQRVGNSIVAFVGGIYGGESANDVEMALEGVAGRFCCRVFAVVIDDSIGPVTFKVEDGDVERYETFTYDEIGEQIKRAEERRNKVSR